MNTLRNEGTERTQAVLLELLKMFDKVCSDNNIEYFLAGGSCLGAVRHGGFLPWDDDIDLYMKASEWEAKKAILAAALPDRYELITHETDELYTNPVIRISDRETTQISRSRVTDNSGKGIMLEIFLLDPVPDDEEAYNEYYDNFWLYCELLSPSMILTNEGVRIGDDLEGRYRELVKRAAGEGREKIVDELAAKLFCYDEVDCSRYHLRWAVHWIEFPISAYEEQKRIKFEDTLMPVAAGFPEVLYGEYGDNWMMIPEMSNVWTHDTVENFDVPHRVYEEKYEKRLDKKAFRRAQEKNKDFKLDRFLIHRSMNQYKADHLEKIALACRERDDFEDVFLKIQEELFGDYRLIPVDEHILYDVLRKRIIAGDLRFADKVSKLYDGRDEGVVELLNDLKEIRRIRFSYFKGNGRENVDAALKMAGKYPGQINMVEFICQLQVDDKGAESEAMDTVRKAIRVHGRRPRLLKILADGYRASGDADKAHALYDEILQESRDGVVNLEISRLLRRQ